MGKAQKNLKLAPEVIEWLNREEKRSGVPHSRIILASLAAYSCLDEDDRRDWMELAVSVDRREMSFWDVRLAAVQRLIARIEADTAYFATQTERRAALKELQFRKSVLEELKGEEPTTGIPRWKAGPEPD